MYVHEHTSISIFQTRLYSLHGPTCNASVLGLRAVEGQRLLTAEGQTRRHLDCGPLRFSACGPQRSDPPASGLLAVEGRRLRTVEGRRVSAWGPAGIWIAGCRGSARVGEGQHWQFITHPVTARESRPIQLPCFASSNSRACPRGPALSFPTRANPLSVGPDGRNGGKLEWKSWIARGSV
jgi:hypothetical protein